MSQLEKKAPALIGGGIFAAMIASLCCVGPVVLTLLGVSGAAVLSKLDFLRIPMIILVVIAFAAAGLTLFKTKNSCEPGSLCADPRKYRLMKIAYWSGLVVALAAITSVYWINWIF